MQFERDHYGFWRQVAPRSFVYTEEYKSRQSTNGAMSFLRLGWLSAGLGGYDTMKSMEVVDIGCGSGEFVKHSKNFFKRVVGYDVAGDSISRTELESTKWDLVVLSDVLEHFEDIDGLFELKWEYAFISFPETPEVSDWRELDEMKFRHFKPDEHLWMMNASGFERWARAGGAGIELKGCFEDAIRTRWDADKPNISSFLLKRAAPLYK